MSTLIPVSSMPVIEHDPSQQTKNPQLPAVPSEHGDHSERNERNERNERALNSIGLLTLGLTGVTNGRQAQKQLEYNEAGQLLGYYDPTTLTPEHDLMGGPVYVRLSHVQGFPTVEATGIPFWERLENESWELYRLFTYYRDEATRPPGLTKSGGKKESERLQGNWRPRDYHIVAQAFDLAPTQVAQVADGYLWYQRARAYDEYAAAARELASRREAELMEGRHSSLARKLLDRVQEAIEEMDPEELSPQAIDQWIKSGVALERISRGLDPAKPTHAPLTPAQKEHEDALKLKLKQTDAKQNNGIDISNNGGTVQIQVVFEDSWQSS